MSQYKTGDRVQWNWGNGHPEAVVKEVFTEKVTRTIKGTEVTRDASPDDPSYMLEQDDGSRVLKGHSELKKI